MRKLALTSILALSLAACNAAPTGPGGGNEPPPGGDPPPSSGGGGGGGGGGGPIEGPPTAKYAGVYSVTSSLDFTQNGVLPGIIGPALGGLSEIHDHPGDAIYTILAGANIPYLSDILNKVPSFLKSALTGALDDLITKGIYQSYPVVDQVASIIQGITEISKKMDMHDDLTIHTPSPDGIAKMEQQITGVGFTLFGQTTVVALPTKSLPAAYSAMNGKVTPAANAPVADATVTVEQGTFSLPVGSLIYGAAGPLIFKNFGGAATLQGALVNLVPCQSWGQSISNSVNNVISATEVQQLCEGALGLVADQVEGQISKVTMDNVHTTNSQGKLYDVSIPKPVVDYQSDRLGDGTWGWQFTVGSGTTTVPASFAGDRTKTAL